MRLLLQLCACAVLLGRAGAWRGAPRARRAARPRGDSSALAAVEGRPADIPLSPYGDASYQVVDLPQVMRERWSIERYDAEAIAAHYRRPLPFLRLVTRLATIGTPLAAWYLRTRWDNATAGWRGPEEEGELRSRRGAELRRAIVATDSVAFIKGGQALSLRPDLVQVREYVTELEKLQDEVDTFSTAVAMQVVADELGVADAREVFDFEAWPPEPVASASIGQVYRATVRGGALAGQRVAVKVQRPSVVGSAAKDMVILRWAALAFKRIKGLRSDMGGIADRFGEQLFDELDYRQELRNARRFRELYGDIDELRVPDVYEAYSGKRVLTMEWIDGEKGPWGEEGSRVLAVGLRCSVSQLFEHGLFHADPHRGNLLLTPEGELAYLDFGMMANVSASTRFGMIGAVIGLQNKDIRLVSENLVALGFLPDATDLDLVVPKVEEAFQKATGGKGAGSLNFTTLNAELNEISYMLPFQTPPFFATIVRTMTILEGLALSVDRDFRLVKGSYPFVAKLLLEDDQPEFKALLRRALVNDDTGGLYWERLEQLISIAAAAGDGYGSAGDAGREDQLKAAQRRADLNRKYAQSGANADEEDVDNSVDGILRILQWLLSDSGAFLRRPLVKDAADAVDSALLAAGNAASALTLGLLPRPGQQPDRERLERISRVLLSALEAQPGGASGARESVIASAIRASQDERLRNVAPAALPLALEVLGELAERTARRQLRRTVELIDIPGIVGSVADVLAVVDDASDGWRRQEDRERQRKRTLPPPGGRGAEPKDADA